MVGSDAVIFANDSPGMFLGWLITNLQGALPRWLRHRESQGLPEPL